MEAGRDADPFSICTAPTQYVEIGLDGQIGACCRAQDVVLGYATSVDEFADAWFGENYRRIRQSLQRDARGDFALPNCEECIRFHAPLSRGGRRAAQYGDPHARSTHVLNFSHFRELRLDAIQKEAGHCYMARLPPGTLKDAFELWENDRVLGPGDALHDDIRSLGQGRYSIWQRCVYFAASDNSDARTNKRLYRLRKVSR
jgi:hypothetical protein